MSVYRGYAQSGVNIISGDGNFDNLAVGGVPVVPGGVAPGSVVLGQYDVAGLPAVANSEGALVYCSDGGGGSPCLAYCDGTKWYQVAIGAEVSDS